MTDISSLIEEAIKSNCVQSQRKIYDLYSGMMFATILRICGSRHDAEDILQDCFIKVYKGLYQFKGEGSFEGWLRKIATNTSINYIKAKVRISEIGDNYSNYSNLNSSTIPHKLQLLDVNYILSKLSSQNRVVFVLYVFEGYSLKSIARHLEIKESACRCRYMRAKRQLKELVGYYESSVSNYVNIV
jgi:RNA polymerase sigma-70 factor (ECF subfamily)